MANSPSAIRTLRLRLGTFLVELYGSRWKSILAVVVVGVCTGLSEYFLDIYLRRIEINQALDDLMDACVVGLASAAVAGIWLLAARERRKRVLQEMSKIAQLNHNIRNALEVIVHSHYVPGDDHTNCVLDSVESIERTLEELFPGLDFSAEKPGAAPSSGRRWPR